MECENDELRGRVKVLEDKNDELQAENDELRRLVEEKKKKP